MTSIDEIFQDISRTGRYQIFQLLLCFVAILSTGVQTLSSIFTTQTPPFRCDTESLEDFSDSNDTDNCFANGSCPNLFFSNDLQSFVTKYGLVCNRAYFSSLISTLYMIGFFWGGTIYGYVSDWFSRRHACLYSGLHTLVCAAASSFAPNYWVFVALRVLTALGASGQISVVITYATESALPKERALYLTVCQIPWSVGLFILCLISYFLHDQTYIDLICATFSLACIAIFFFCQESPRWLISQGEADKARAALERIASINKRNAEIDAQEFRKWVASKLVTEEKEEVEENSISDLFLYPGLRRLTLSLCFIYSVVSLVYYGFFYGISSLHGLSIYSQVMIGAGIELLMNPCLYPVLKHCERLWLKIGTFVIAGSFTLVVSFLIGDPSMSVIVTVLCSIARPAGSFLFNIIVLYTVEMYPTTHRTFGVGCGSAASRLGTILATQLVSLGVFWQPAPYVLVTGCCGLVILLTLFLPESKYKSCPETVAEAEDIIKKHCFFRDQLMCQNKFELPESVTVSTISVQNA